MVLTAAGFGNYCYSILVVTFRFPYLLMYGPARSLFCCCCCLCWLFEPITTAEQESKAALIYNRTVETLPFLPRCSDRIVFRAHLTTITTKQQLPFGMIIAISVISHAHVSFHSCHLHRPNRPHSTVHNNDQSDADFHCTNHWRVFSLPDNQTDALRL